MAGNDHHQIRSGGWSSSPSSSSSISSSRKGKKSSSSSSSSSGTGSDQKPKQPQRGLGVAQLEKIRLHGELNCPSAPPPAFDHHHHYPAIYPSTLNHHQLQEELRSAVLQAPYPSSSSIPASSSSFSYSTSPPPNYAHHYPNNIMQMGAGHEYHERANIRFGDSQAAATTASWYPSNNMLEAQHIAQPSMTRQLLISDIEDAQGKRVKKHRSKSLGSQNYDEDQASESQELDLELRLSL